jgi:L-alanine-DL-glutamate epimerase-like enolase superfamily enzyme
MKITRLKTAVVEGNFDWTFVKIESDKGLSGIGECFFAPGLTSILHDLEPVIVGQDPRNIRPLFKRLQMAASGAGSVAGIVYNAISGIEAALWDLLGQSLGVPIYMLLGGKFRDSVRIYADCHGGESLESLDAVLHTHRPSWAPAQSSRAKFYFDDDADCSVFTPEMYGEQARKMVAAGFTALKFDIDVPNPYKTGSGGQRLSNKEIDYMLSLIAGVRAAVDPNIDIAIDCHWRFNLSDARLLAAGCEQFRLMWLEDPLPPQSVDGFSHLQAGTRTPIGTGENFYLFDGFRGLLQKQAIGVACPDIQKIGGLHEALRVAEFAGSCDIPIAPHNISSPIGTMASVHLCAAVPNFLALEFHASDVPFWADLVTGNPGPIIEHGYIRVPDAPGLGVKLNEEVARKFAKPDEPFFE